MPCRPISAYIAERRTYNPHCVSCAHLPAHNFFVPFCHTPLTFSAIEKSALKRTDLVHVLFSCRQRSMTFATGYPEFIFYTMCYGLVDSFFIAVKGIENFPLLTVRTRKRDYSTFFDKTLLIFS